MFSSSPRYSATCYEWKDPGVYGRLELQEGYIGITKSANDALRNFRRSERLRTLWIDSICINQADRSEKRQQVSMMGRIYKKATRLLVWLGKAMLTDCYAFWILSMSEDLESMTSEDKDKVFEDGVEVGGQYEGEKVARQEVRWRRKRPERCPTCLQPSDVTRTDEKHGNSILSWLASLESFLPFHEELRGRRFYVSAMESLELLFRRSYFRRLWTLQETILPKKDRVTYYA